MKANFKILGYLVNISIHRTGLPRPRSRTGKALKAKVNASGAFVKIELVKAVRKYAREIGLDPSLVEAKEWVETVYPRGVIRK